MTRQLYNNCLCRRSRKVLEEYLTFGYPQTSCFNWNVIIEKEHCTASVGHSKHAISVNIYCLWRMKRWMKKNKSHLVVWVTYLDFMAIYFIFKLNSGNSPFSAAHSLNGATHKSAPHLSPRSSSILAHSILKQDFPSSYHSDWHNFLKTEWHLKSWPPKSQVFCFSVFSFPPA